jgi:hypothetical protein
MKENFPKFACILKIGAVFRPRFLIPKLGTWPTFLESWAVVKRTKAWENGYNNLGNSNLIFPPLPTSPFTELASSTRMTETLVKQYLLSKKAAVQWIQNVLAEETLPGLKDDLFQHLVDGVTLCKIMQKIS